MFVNSCKLQNPRSLSGLPTYGLSVLATVFITITLSQRRPLGNFREVCDTSPFITAQSKANNKQPHTKQSN